MASIFTIDASAFISAFNPGEVSHNESRRLFERIQNEATPLIEPTLLLPEIAASVARAWDDSALGQALAAAIKALPHVTLAPLNTALADTSAALAAQLRLRGSDVVYAAVAQRYGAILVTLDREQLSRLGSVLTVRTPAQALAEWRE